MEITDQGTVPAQTGSLVLEEWANIQVLLRTYDATTVDCLAWGQDAFPAGS